MDIAGQRLGIVASLTKMASSSHGFLLTGKILLEDANRIKLSVSPSFQFDSSLLRRMGDEKIQSWVRRPLTL